MATTIKVIMNKPPYPGQEPPAFNEIYRFFDLSLDLLAIVSNGIFVRLNPAWEETLGYPIEEMLSRPVVDFIHPDDLARTVALREQIIADGGTLTRFENRYRHKDGTYRWLEWTARRYAQEDISYCVARDVTKRKKTEEVLHQNEEVLRSLLDGLPNLAWMIQPDGTVLAMNQRQADLFKRPMRELIGQNIFDLMAEDNDDTLPHRKALIEQVCVSGEQTTIELERNGRYVQSTLTPLKNFQGEVVTVVISNHEITELKRTEAALRQSEQALLGLLDGMPSYALMMRPDGTILALNQRMAAIFQRERDELIGQNYFDLSPDIEVEDELKARFARAIRSKTQQTEEFEFGGIQFESRMTPIIDNGEVFALVTSSYDITHLKQTEIALRKSKEYFRSVWDAAAEGILLTNSDGEITLVNKQIESQFGYSREELIGQSVDILLPEANRGIHVQHRQAYIAEPDVRPMGIGRDLAGRRKDGSVFPVEVSLSYIENDGELLLMALVVDITARKQAEAALRKSEEQFRSVLESAAEGILVTDRGGDIILVNREIERQFGYAREELVGSPVDILLPETQRQIHLRHRKRYMTHPDVRSMGVGRELMGRRKDGSVFPVEVSLSYTQSDELLVMAFVVDISERKQIERERLDHEKLQLEVKKERELIELRQRFMSMISHEFRTPLTAIASSCEILDHYYDRLTNEQRIERVRGLNSYVHIMVSLLDDILMLNKIQAGMVELQPEPLELDKVCRRVFDTAVTIDRERHQMVFSAQQVPRIIQADRRVLEHILSNLLSNAIKYSPPGTQIDFQLSSDEDRLRFVVKDEGRGIPEEEQKRLFQPFHRARNAQDVSGTGLGLAIVKSNVELYGGSIRFQSAEGKGTTFWVELPVNVS
jgi:PAS domain S-box-containing protein